MSIDNPTNKEEHIQSALTLLGHPVIRVNVTPDQLLLAVKQSMKKYVDYHNDATDSVWIAQEITGSIIENKSFIAPDEVEAVTYVHGLDHAAYRNGLGFISSGTDIPGNQSGYSIDNFTNIFYDTVTVFLNRRALSYFNNIQNAPEVFRFNALTKEVQIDVSDSFLVEGNYIVYQANVNLANTVNAFWSDDWFIRYTAAMIKKQWGNNLSKYQNVELLGGYTMNGGEILSTAKEELSELEEELFDSLSFEYTGIAIG